MRIAQNSISGAVKGEIVMRPRIATCVFIALFTVVFVGVGPAAPVNLKLLPLVPPGAQIVSGFENKPNKAGGPLLLTTMNNVLDLDDLRSLFGVDPKRGFNEVIEVSFAPSGASLNEHLLLVAGSFNRDRIFSAAELNGATSAKYLSATVLTIQPFTREKGQMKDTRWLSIIDDRIAIFGTQWMVQQALNRYDNHASADPILMKRLALFRRDVGSWNVFSSMPNLRQSVFLQSRGPFSALFDGADVMMVGVCFDSKVRVDLLLNGSTQSGTVDIREKAAQFSRIFGQEWAGDNAHMPQLRGLKIEQNRVQASVVLSNDDFLQWKGGQVQRDQASLDLARGKAKN
jgi:hypothetical protein